MSQRLESPLLWIEKNPVWRFCGAEDANSDSGEVSATSGDDSSNSGSDSDSSGASDDKGQEQASATVSKADFDALMARMQAADRAKSAAEAKVREYEDKDKSELEKAQQDAEEAKNAKDELAKRLQDLSVQNAFLASNKHSWHSPSAALKLLERDLVTIEDDGTVKGMDTAIEKLAKDNPFLIKADSDKTSDGKAQPSGAANNGSGGGSKNANRQEMERKYPALRGR